MESHDQTTDLLDQTVATLSNGSITVAANEGTNLIEHWVQVLQESENTRMQDIAGKLQQLREALDNPSPHSENIHGLLHELAEAVTIFSGDTGSEGEITTQLQSLATALRNTGNQISTTE